ncbi:uncharacterized protein LOC107367436 [Tetranychus urticae]|uniref:Uncharacterized protein n=1 Tax=Tetranychus urticae TaxID=32264 RepID=T1JST4_TETUR|nr:uncharacterized protein LOC107367436 [Tetranychus urticae]
MALVRVINNSARGKFYQTGLYQLNNSRRNYSEDPAPNPIRKWKRWQDVPDNLVKTYSERDPYNMVYQDKEWIMAKKKQLWWTQDMNMNPDFPYGKTDLYKVYVAYIVVGALGMWSWYVSMEEDFTLYRSKVKEMRANPPDWRTPADKKGLVFCES